MKSDNDNLCIVFNGEIYNYLELGKKFIQRGGSLKTNSDTEVVLALYEEMGSECLKVLRGMFAFAIFNKEEKSIFLARDRVGIKPLYYSLSDRSLIFGSEIKSLLQWNGCNAEANFSSISSYLKLRYARHDRGLFKNIEKLKPGCWMKWRQGKTKHGCFWKPRTREKNSQSLCENRDQFLELFTEAVKLRQMGEVPSGAYLSGGIDSTAVVRTLENLTSGSLKTFTAGFGWEGDETQEAHATAHRLETRHSEIVCENSMFEHLPKIIWHSDEPLGDAIVFPTYALASEASKSTKFVLTGEGADETLFGYLFHKAIHSASIYNRHIPEILHDFGVLPSLHLLPSSFLNKFFNYPGDLGKSGKQRLIEFLCSSRNADAATLFYDSITLFTENDQLDLFLDKDLVEKCNEQKRIKNNLGYLDTVYLEQFDSWLPDNILMRQDKLSMANGLEARVPFLDHELIEFLETVPGNQKLDIFQNKKLLRAAFQHELAAKRKKTAFYFPLELFCKTPEFIDILSQTLGEASVKNRGLFKIEKINKLKQKMFAGDFLAAKKVFSLISLELWFQIFMEKKYGSRFPMAGI